MKQQEQLYYNGEPLSAPLSVAEKQGKVLKLADDFRQRYIGWNNDREKVLPSHDNPHAKRPPGNPEEFLRRFQSSPEKNRAFAQELFTILSEIDAAGGMLWGKKLHPHQCAQIIHIAECMCAGKNSPRTFLIEGSQGTGKTIVLGVMMMASTRLQVRGVLKGRAIFCTQKIYHLQQQTQSAGMRRNQVLRAPPFTLRPEEWSEFHKVHLEPLNDTFRKKKKPKKSEREHPITHDEPLFSKEDWNLLYRPEKPYTVSEAEQALEESLRTRKCFKAFTRTAPQWKTVLQQTAELMANQGTVILSEDGEPKLIRLEPVPDLADTKKAYTGDLGAGIPQEYVDSDLVLAREGAELDTAHKRQLHGHIDPNQIQSDLRARVFLTLGSTVKVRNQRHTIGHLIPDTDVLIVDEAQKDRGAVYQNIVLDSRIERDGNAADDDPPFVFSASAERFSERSGMGIPQNDVHTGSIPISEAMNQNITPAAAPVMFPAADAPHYPSDTLESMEQFFEALFRDYPLLKEKGQDPIWKRNGIIVVHKKLVPVVVKRLRMEYEALGWLARVESLNANSKAPYSGRLLSAMTSPGTNILVASSEFVSKALDLPNLRMLAIATKSGIDMKNFHGIVGRLEHSNLHHSEGVGYNGVLLQGIFSDSDPRVNLFHALDHGIDMKHYKERGTLPFVPTQALHGEQALVYDIKFLRDHTDVGCAQEEVCARSVGFPDGFEALPGTSLVENPELLLEHRTVQVPKGRRLRQGSQVERNGHVPVPTELNPLRLTDEVQGKLARRAPTPRPRTKPVSEEQQIKRRMRSATENIINQSIAARFPSETPVWLNEHVRKFMRLCVPLYLSWDKKEGEVVRISQGMEEAERILRVQENQYSRGQRGIGEDRKKRIDILAALALEEDESANGAEFLSDFEAEPLYERA